MNNLTIVIFFIGLITMAAAGMKYIAIPIDGIDVIEVNPIVRYPRQTESYVLSNVQSETESQLPRIDRSNSQILDYVDFGAQTANNGAYSWYADYPAQRH